MIRKSFFTQSYYEINVLYVESPEGHSISTIDIA
jgi:hypothetical protein